MDERIIRIFLFVIIFIKHSVGQIGTACTADPSICNTLVNGECSGTLGICFCITGYIIVEGDCSYTCGSLSHPANGFVNTQNGVTPGESATYSCDPGYQLSGVTTRHCFKSVGWGGTAPTCDQDCGDLTNPVNGKVVTPFGTTTGSIATYTCNTGFNITGITSRTCVEHIGWENFEPTCSAGCGSLIAPLNGIISTQNGSSTAEMAIYACDPGYMLRGVTIRRCNKLIGWDGTEPSCVQVVGHPENSNTVWIIVISVLCVLILVLIVAVIIILVRKKRAKRNEHQPQVNMNVISTFDNPQTITTSNIQNEVHDYLELDDTSSNHNYNTINTGTPNEESNEIDACQYETPDVPPQNEGGKRHIYQNVKH